VWLLVIKIILIRARATGTLGIIKEGEDLGREEEGVETEVEAEDEARHVRTMRTRSKRTIQRTNY
jgi:hypothetical protein